MTTSNRPAQDLRWLLDNFLDQVPGTAHAIVVSTDGLPLSASRGFPADQADRLAAIASGLASLAQGASLCFQAGDVRQMILEMEQGYLFVMAVGDGSCLAVLASASSDLGLIGYEMSLLVSRVGRALTPALRAPTPSPGPR